jgi:hypothetical protein
MNRSVVIRMFVVEFRFAAARILHDRETERQRDGKKDGEMGRQGDGANRGGKIRCRSSAIVESSGDSETKAQRSAWPLF